MSDIPKDRYDTGAYIGEEMTYGREEETPLLSRSEKTALVVMLLSVGVLTALDVYEDWFEGATLGHILPEVLIIVVTVITALQLLKRFARSRQLAVEQAKTELEQVRAESTHWKGRAENLRSGVIEGISSQMNEWKLTEAEQEVSLLLIKGLSIKEIASVRQTSERTIRQQASDIYRKSGLSGRAQLSAFFLEDLF